MVKRNYRILGRVTPIKSEAEQYAKGARHALKRNGVPFKGRIKVMKTPSGYAAVDTQNKGRR
jgi:hypothetical protein